MKSIRSLFLFSAVILSVSLIGSCKLPDSSKIPPHAYLTWALEDTARTMTVNFHSHDDLKQVLVHYDTVSRNGEISEYAFTANSTSVYAEAIKRRIHKIDLTGLSPATVYYFTVSDGDKALIGERKFRTLPDDGSPIRFVSGGDMNPSTVVDALNKVAGEQGPMFALVGGDIAYDNGNPLEWQKWDQWLTSWTTYMVTPSGESVPIIAAPGNHEVIGGYKGGFERATFYRYYFNQEPGQSYFSRKVGANTVVYSLDTGHISSIPGEQTEWLRSEMQRHAEVPNQIAFYHVPMYPSAREFSQQNEMIEARKHWLPIFDEFGLDVSFENHDHALKRSKLLKNNQVAADGTLYLGDGCWGMKTRTAHPDRWYLEKAEGIRHVWLGEIDGSTFRFKALGQQGEILDQVTLQK